MKKYQVIIRATVTKTLHVEADNEEDAVMMAHEEFDVANDHNDENYEQDTIAVTEWGAK